MEKQKRFCWKYCDRLDTEDKEKLGTKILFLVTFAYVLVQLMIGGSMVDKSGDAADIWKTITTWYTDDRYASYVMYKGFSSVYPYVWLYQMARFLHINDFFFIMCYHAILFSYITVIGIPVLVEAIAGYKPKLWQKVMLVVALYWVWDNYRVLSQIMVDLPSCAFFLMSAHCATRIGRCSGWKRYAMVSLTGLLCGLIANISGQYSISAVCIAVYAAVVLWKSRSGEDGRKKTTLRYVFWLGVMLLLMLSVRTLKAWFNAAVVVPLVEQGGWIPSGQSWMERALFYMMSVGRQFYGYKLVDHRGIAIAMDIYGEAEGTRLLELSGAGGYGWSILQWFWAFFHYPVDYIHLFLNRLIIMISDDRGRGSLPSLLASYTLVYLTLLTAVKRMKRLKDLFHPGFWLVLGALASIIPTLVMCVEIRVTISFQSLLYGMAIAGPILPEIWETVSSGVRQCWQDKSLRSLMDREFPWELMCWLLFCLLCLGYFGAICAGSDAGTSILYR